MFQNLTFPSRLFLSVRRVIKTELSPSVGVAIAALVCLTFICSTTRAQTAEFTQSAKSGNAMTIQVPLVSYPGRGINLPINLTYTTQGLWRIGSINSVEVNAQQVTNSVAEAIYAEHSLAGWKSSLDVPEIEWPKLNDRYWADGKPYATQGLIPHIATRDR